MVSVKEALKLALLGALSERLQAEPEVDTPLRITLSFSHGDDAAETVRLEEWVQPWRSKSATCNTFSRVSGRRLMSCRYLCCASQGFLNIKYVHQAVSRWKRGGPWDKRPKTDGAATFPIQHYPSPRVPADKPAQWILSLSATIQGR